MFISHYNGPGIKLVRPLSTVDNTRDYARVSHSRQWSNYNIPLQHQYIKTLCVIRREEYYQMVAPRPCEFDNLVKRSWPCVLHVESLCSCTEY